MDPKKWPHADKCRTCQMTPLDAPSLRLQYRNQMRDAVLEFSTMP